jgi:hypothetical protein
MLTIFKYEIPIEDSFQLRLPRYAKILAFQAQRDVPQIWALVDSESRANEVRQFRLSGTGQPLKESATDLNYIGTCQQHYGALVWHLFEVIPFLIHAEIAEEEPRDGE